MEKVHDRMPVILKPEAYAQWLDPAEQTPDKLGKLLKPYPASQMAAFSVSRLVNDPKNDSPECIVPVK
jgi:putative SOS response-associated peptidase YedK